jgi:hypothetical protein
MWTLHFSLTGYVLVLVRGYWRPMEVLHPLETTLQEIEKAIDAGLCYAALVVALTLPDICATLESENAYSGNREYKKWYRENLAHKFHHMTDEVAYSLRCGMVHQGNLQIKTKGAEPPRVIFTLPHVNAVVHNMKMNWHGGSYLQFDAVSFCHDMIAAVRDWYNRKKDDAIVQANLPNLLRVHPNGSGPVGGLAVLA